VVDRILSPPMGSPDTIFHDLANQDPTAFARLVLADRTVVAEGLPASLPIVRRRDGDALFVVRRRNDASDVLLHVECDFEGRNLPNRLLEYTAILAKREHREAASKRRQSRPIVSALIRLTGPRRPPRTAVHKVSGLDGPTIVFRYIDIEVPGLAAEDLLASGHPALWALVPLAKGGTSEEVLERAVSGIEGAKVSPEQRVALRTANWVFASLVGVTTMVERLSKMKRFRDIPAIREIQDRRAAEVREETLEELRRTLVSILEHQLRSRFGDLEQADEARLQAASVSELEQWARRVLDAKRIEDVFVASTAKRPRRRK
jgi:hypothetical protein